MPKGQPLEMPLHPKRVRVFPATVANNPRAESFWSSLELMTQPTPSTSRGPLTSSSMLAAPLSPPSPTPSIQTDVLDTAPSSGLYVDSGASSRTKTKRPVSPGVDGFSSKIRRHLIPPSSDRPLQDDELSALLNYGSEEESDEEDEMIAQPLVSRVARMFAEEDEEVEEVSINITLEWPPQLRRPSSPAPASPTPASPTPVSPSPVEPSDKFKFDWRGFPMPQIEPQLRREPFSHINSGPTVSFTKPYDAFIAIWDREIMQLIVRETNIYAQQLATTMLENGMIHPRSRITRWQDTNVNELYTYLAIVMAMGLVIKSRLEEYWGTDKDIFCTPGFSTNMSYDRFMLLSKCIHFNNNMNCNSGLTRPQAKLFKIKPIIDDLNRKFSELYIPSQNVALDESLTMWKGWLDINQFIRNKAATVGVKTYEVCESKTGYLWRFEVYAGHETLALQEADPVSGIIPSLVLRLLNGLEHKGHTIWMDNFYNSPALARELKVRGFDCVGTLRTNRQFIPSELANMSKKDMAVGQVVGCTSGDVDIMVWRDKSHVAFISTYHGVSSTRCGETLKPTVVLDYNVCMGGVDRKDQQLSMYPIERKRTRVWYKTFFRRLLNASVLNTHILLANQLLTHRQFRKALIIDLLSAHGTRTPTSNTIKAVHAPAQYELITPGKTDRLKRKCAVCGKRTITYCKACNVAMCVFTCYEPYHTSH